MKGLVAVVGPTAVGKSQLGCLIAEVFPAEIVNADSRQIYRYMDIGTAKPPIEDRQRIPHHLLDVILPDQVYSLALYQQAARAAIACIQSHNRLPLLIGGSGQYIWSIIEGWQVPQVPPDIEYRRTMQSRAAETGTEALFRELEQLDPLAASRMDPHNLKRIIRALEIYKETGRKPSELQLKTGVDYPVLILGLTTERETLYRLIDARAERMIEKGFIDEVKNLLEMGYSPGLPSMSSLGYREISAFLFGKIDLADAIARIKFETHRFARSQYAWFHLNDERIRWFQATTHKNDNRDDIIYTIKTFLDIVEPL